MADLEQAFGRKAADALLDDAEARLYGDADNLAFEFLQDANENLRDYGERNEYNYQPVLESGQVTETRRTATSVSARVEWLHEVANMWEVGISPHTINGNPLLHFYWERIGQWIQTESVEWGSITGGVPAARFVRDAIASWRAKLQRRGPGGRFR